jgi:O-antigen/teichoic acid export membrane protein
MTPDGGPRAAGVSGDRPGAVRHSRRDTVGYLPSAVLPALFSLAGSAVYTRIFPPQQYGVYTLLGAVTGPVLSLAAQPAAQAVNRFLAEYDERGEMHRYRQAVSWLVVLTVSVMTLLSAAALWVWPRIGSRSISELALAGALSGLLASIVYNMLTPALMAAIRVRAYRRAAIWTQGLGLVIPLALLALLGHHIAWLLWGNALGVVGVLPYVVRRAAVLERPRPLDPAERATLARFWNYGAPMTLWFFASSMLNVGDRYVIQAYHGTRQVGLYGANYAIAAQGVALLTNPLLNATGPRLLRQWAQGDREGARQTMSRMTSVYMMLGMALIGLTAVAGNALVRILLARPFHPGAAVLVPVLAGAVVWGASRIGHKSMEFLEKNRLMVWDVLAAAAVNMGLNVLLVPRYGYVAAGYTTLVSYVLYTLLIWWQARAWLPWDIPWPDLAVYAAAALAGWGVDRWAVLNRPWPPVLILLVASALFLLVYAAVLLWWFRRRGNPLTRLFAS